MSTSRENDVQSLSDAQTSLQPLPNIPLLAERERSYFDSYAQGKALGDWFEHEIIVLGHLAKLSVIVDDLIKDVDDTGTTITKSNGDTAVNPDLVSMQSTMRLELSCIKSLRLAVKEGREKPSKRSDVSKRTVKEQDKKIVSFEKGCLLARPD